MIKLKNKLGELTTQQIVILIIIIVSFIILLFLLFRLNLGEETDIELCHNSVATRGSSVIPTEAIPLNCKTTYLCLTKDGNCESLANPEIKKIQTEKEVYKALANEMSLCWWMFGQGEIDYIGTGFTKNNYCSICSTIFLDESLKEIKEFENGEISKDNLYNFLAEGKYSDKQTYAQYLFGTNDIALLKQTALKNEEREGTFGKLEVGKQYYNVMGITSELGNTYKWVAGIGTVVGLVVAFATPFGWVGGAIVVGSVLVGIGGEVFLDEPPEILSLTVQGKGIDNSFMAPTIIEAESVKFKALNCEEIVTTA